MQIYLIRSYTNNQSNLLFIFANMRVKTNEKMINSYIIYFIK